MSSSIPSSVHAQRWHPKCESTTANSPLPSPPLPTGKPPTRISGAPCPDQPNHGRTADRQHSRTIPPSPLSAHPCRQDVPCFHVAQGGVSIRQAIPSPSQVGHALERESNHWQDPSPQRRDRQQEQQNDAVPVISQVVPQISTANEGNSREAEAEAEM